MDNAPLRSSAFVVGGLFIGIWLFLGFFPTELFVDLQIDTGRWWFWGMIGLAIAGGLFAGRVVNDNVRIGIWITLGIATGMLIGAAIFGRIGEAFAALFTAGGGAIIVSGLPSMQWGATPGTAPPPVYEDPQEVEERRTTRAPRSR